MLENNRISQWFIGALLAWTLCSLVVFIPIFHLLLGFPIEKIVVSASIGCVVQLVFTPWLFSARATPQNPNGKVARRSAVVVVWLTLTALLFFYYIQRSWPSSSDARIFRICLFGTTIAAGIVALIAIGIVSRKQDR
jgi:hypothetical protein